MDKITENKKLHNICIRCGRKLKNEENRERGMGKVCWEKYQKENRCKRLW